MPSVVDQAPCFNETDAARLAQEIFGITVTTRLLPSERDQNFALREANGAGYVLKIANAAEDVQRLDFQNAAMAHLAQNIHNFAFPRVCPTRSGDQIAQVTGESGAVHYVRLLTFVPGVCLAHVRPHTAELLEDVGRLAGSIACAFRNFSHPDMDRPLHWDIRHTAEMRAHTGDIADPEHQALAIQVLDRFDRFVAPRLGNLRAGVIYNDANDYNVLVNAPESPRRLVIGAIDFGDMVHSALICELAVACAYAMLGKADPLAAATHVIHGFHTALPLEESEIELLYDLICARLCISVTLSAYQQRLAPNNEYLSVSEVPAWELLTKLAATNPFWAMYVFRDACGLEPCPNGAAAARWIAANPQAIGPVIDADLHTDPLAMLDLSIGSLEIGSPEHLKIPGFFDALVAEQLMAAGAHVAIGRYNEPRLIYTAGQFHVGGDEYAERRTVHMGIDLFVEPGRPVFAPLDGVIHSLRDNNLPLDYGPTIILAHTIGDLTFYTLYGHLSRESLNGLTPGMHVRRGDKIAEIGSDAVNGGWPPHLHIQIMGDMLGMNGDFPGVIAASRRTVWLSLCPDPNLLLGIPAQHFLPPDHTPTAILEIRRQHLGRSLSISYRKPLTIVRGFMQNLYDHTGRMFLDAVNNVPHVGHNHPRVVRAAQRQMAVLNTNTRYLHQSLALYIERLCATLPEPFSVVYLVNSGSEANELALRMARAHTRHHDVLTVDGAYHGHTNALIDISPYKFDGPGGRGAPEYVHKVIMPDPYRGPYRGSEQATGIAYARHVEETILAAREHGRMIAAFFCESLLGCGGQVVLPEGYLQEAYRFVRNAGGVCIADEVQVGFGRVGTHFWGFETQGVIPDIVTMGKPIGNGHPLAAVVTTPEIADSFNNGMEYFNTFGGNPVSCAVGMAVLDVMRDEQLQERARSVGERIRAGIRALMPEHALIGDVRGLGMFIGVELVRNHSTLEPAAAEASYIAERMCDHGILISTEGPYHNVLKIKPPLAFGPADSDRLVATLDTLLREDFTRARLAE